MPTLPELEARRAVLLESELKMTLAIDDAPQGSLSRRIAEQACDDWIKEYDRVCDEIGRLQDREWERYCYDSLRERLADRAHHHRGG